MRHIKSLIAIPLAALGCLALLSACDAKEQELTPEETAKGQELIKSIEIGGNMKPGAKVETSRSDSGIQVTYENPDGSGGGVLAID